MHIMFIIEDSGNLHTLLFDGGRINAATSWYSIMNYAVTNRLSYKAISDLLDLIKVIINVVI